MAPPIVMPINCLERGYGFGEVCRKAAEWGFDGVEFRRSPTGQQMGAEEYLDTIARAKDASGLKREVPLPWLAADLTAFGITRPRRTRSAEAGRNPSGGGE